MHAPRRFLVAAVGLLTSIGIAALEIMTFEADVHFDTYSTDIPLSRQASLNEAIEKTRQMKERRFFALVVGHADRLEAGVMSAESLAMERGRAVASLIQAQGFPATCIHVESKADRQPVHPPPDQRNSRVEVEFVEHKGDC